MRILYIDSKAYGLLQVKLDNEDYDRIYALRRWTASRDRGKFYFHKRVSKKDKVTMHRFLARCPKGLYVDHINGNTLDNRKSNLRICTNADNLRNGRLRPNNTSGYTGVGKTRKGEWAARIRVNYKYIELGIFENKEDAIKARKEGEKKYWYGGETNKVNRQYNRTIHRSIL